MFLNKRYFFISVFLFSFFYGCGNKSEIENQMRKIVHSAKTLEEEGKLKESFLEYQKIVPLKEKNPEVFDALGMEDFMSKRGWSSKSLDMSYTLKLMSNLQNKVNDYLQQTKGELPSADNPDFICEDAWGRRILIEKRISFKHRKHYDYMIKSLGKDGKWDTFDDLMFINKAFDQYSPKQKEKKKVKAVQKKRLGEKAYDLNELIKIKKTKENKDT